MHILHVLYSYGTNHRLDVSGKNFGLAVIFRTGLTEILLLHSHSAEGCCAGSLVWNTSFLGPRESVLYDSLLGPRESYKIPQNKTLRCQVLGFPGSLHDCRDAADQ